MLRIVGERLTFLFYLTQCTYQLVLESQLPHEIVNFIFQLVIANNKLTILWGSRLFKNNQ